MVAEKTTVVSFASIGDKEIPASFLLQLSQ